MFSKGSVERIYKWTFDTTKNLLVVVAVRVFAAKSGSAIIEMLHVALVFVFSFSIAYTVHDALSDIPILRRAAYGGGLLRFTLVRVPFVLAVAAVLIEVESRVTAELIRAQMP